MKRVDLMAAGFLLLAAPAGARELRLDEAMLAAERASPDLKAAVAREAQARDAIGVSRSYYYPTLDAEGIQSYGFAGSNGALGLAGIPSSPFRSGPSGALVSRLTLFDLSRGYGVQVERSLLEAAKARTRVVLTAVDQATVRAYFESVRQRGQAESWRSVGGELQVVLKEVDRLVRTGQHSVVEQLLVKDQVDDAAMNEEAASSRYAIALRRLALLTGLDARDVAVPSPAALDETAVGVISGQGGSSSVDQAEAESRAAGGLVRQRAAAELPSVAALGSVGGMDKVRLVDRANYSAGIGVDIPLFQGFRLSDETSRAKDLARERGYIVESAKLAFDEGNAAYDESIESSRVKLRHLDAELRQAERALSLARQRYRSFEGPLVDVREAIRDLARIRLEQADEKAGLLSALGEKAVLDGGHVAPAVPAPPQ